MTGLFHAVESDSECSASPPRSDTLASLGPKVRLAGLAKPTGFTLIEVMVAILVSGIVLMGVFAFGTIQKDTANLQQRQVLLQQALEGSMHSIGTDLRMAGLGFGRTCSEVRVWSQADSTRLTPS